MQQNSTFFRLCSNQLWLLDNRIIEVVKYKASVTRLLLKPVLNDASHALKVCKTSVSNLKIHFCRTYLSRTLYWGKLLSGVEPASGYTLAFIKLPKPKTFWNDRDRSWASCLPNDRDARFILQSTNTPLSKLQKQWNHVHVSPWSEVYGIELSNCKRYPRSPFVTFLRTQQSWKSHLCGIWGCSKSSSSTSATSVPSLKFNVSKSLNRSSCSIQRFSPSTWLTTTFVLRAKDRCMTDSTSALRWNS